MFSAICHIWRILSSATLASTQSSQGFQEKSEILLVWPPWMNMSSGGPSSASSGVCSWSILWYNKARNNLQLVSQPFCVNLTKCRKQKDNTKKITRCISYYKTASIWLSNATNAQQYKKKCQNYVTSKRRNSAPMERKTNSNNVRVSLMLYCLPA